MRLPILLIHEKHDTGECFCKRLMKKNFTTKIQENCCTAQWKSIKTEVIYIYVHTYLIFSSSIYDESQMHEMKPIYHNEMQSTTNKTIKTDNWQEGQNHRINECSKFIKWNRNVLKQNLLLIILEGCLHGNWTLFGHHV